MDEDHFHIKSISQAHQIAGLTKPKHPLVSVVKTKDLKPTLDFQGLKVVNHLYQITLKDTRWGSVRYGKSSYDYEEGTLSFTSPGQVTMLEDDPPIEVDNSRGWVLVFHPDLIRKSTLGDKIDSYSFFNYEVNEALHLSEEELNTLEDLLDKIVNEYNRYLDKHSQHLITSNIELFLDYCTRFYDRQFIARKNLNSDVVTKFERFLKIYYSSEELVKKGIPSVSYCAKSLNISTNYLSDLLKKETGKSAQEHIHLFILEKAKYKLLNSNDSVSDVAYDLGFEYPQHFSQLFKSKIGMSPKDYRNLN